MFNHRSLCDVAIRIAIVGILAFWHTPVAAQLPEGLGPPEKALIEEIDGAAKLDATGRVSGIAFNRGATTSVFIRLGIMESVTALDLQFSSVTDEGLVHLRNFPSLGRLVAPVAMTDKGLASIAEHCPHLEELDVSFSKITDAGMPSIAKLTALRALYLTATDVGDVGMAHVVACQHLRCL
ncbi:MAG: hypothetical protein U1E05_24570, partial [Patescibacteria group bacterium]|nr:hypothetical protein [Patescibacteria group bacterium]